MLYIWGMIQFQKILKFFSSCQLHQSQEGDPVTYELVNFMSLTKNLLKEMGVLFSADHWFFLPRILSPHGNTLLLLWWTALHHPAHTAQSQAHCLLPRWTCDSGWPVRALWPQTQWLAQGRAHDPNRANQNPYSRKGKVFVPTEMWALKSLNRELPVTSSVAMRFGRVDDGGWSQKAERNRSHSSRTHGSSYTWS